MSFEAADVDPYVPVWRFDDGKCKNERPTKWFTDAQKALNSYGSKNVIGRVAVNQFGEYRYLTEIQFQRFKHLFEGGYLEERGPWVNNYVPREYGLSGYDTEGMGAQFHNLGHNPFSKYVA